VRRVARCRHGRQQREQRVRRQVWQCAHVCLRVCVCVCVCVREDSVCGDLRETRCFIHSVSVQSNSVCDARAAKSNTADSDRRYSVLGGHSLEHLLLPRLVNELHEPNHTNVCVCQ
jgi:hypothetical protein